MSEQDSKVIVRYLNQSGALVEITEQLTRDAYGYGGLRPQYAATCGGCLDGHAAHYAERSLTTTRTWAAKHAETCRALPQPEPTNQ